MVERIKKRVEMDDAVAICNLGRFYRDGKYGVPQDHIKALELFHRAGELGWAESYHNIGYAFHYGRGAVYYWELAAMMGHVEARCNLGILEERVKNMSIALNHYIIAVGCGHDLSLKKIREFYMNGNATKDDFTTALRSYQKCIDGIKSAQRDEAAAFNIEEYTYM